MSTPARQRIFEALRQADASSSEPDRATIERAAADLLATPDAIRPARAARSLPEAFIERINSPKVAASAESIASLDQLPTCAAAWLGTHRHPLSVCLQPVDALSRLRWAEAGMTTGAEPDDGVAIGIARWGIAETGSLVFHSSADTPILLGFLPAVSIVAVASTNLLWHLEDYAAAARAAADPAPRNACLITGASGTTDIEGRLVTGAHGPRELHVVVIDAL